MFRIQKALILGIMAFLHEEKGRCLTIGCDDSDRRDGASIRKAGSISIFPPLFVCALLLAGQAVAGIAFAALSVLLVLLLRIVQFFYKFMRIIH